MASINELEEQFGVPRIVRIDAGRGGLARVWIRSSCIDGVLVYLPPRRHVTHFQPANQPQVLFLSKSSYFESGRPIRGGVPIVFPCVESRARRAAIAAARVCPAVRLGDRIVRLPGR